MVPAHVARLVAFAALALLGVMQWQRLIAGLSAGRAVLWVVVAVLGALAVLWASTRPRWPATLTVGATLASLLGAYAASGLPLHLLKPREWDDLIAGLWGGAEALSTVALPYEATDPWPALTLQLLGRDALRARGAAGLLAAGARARAPVPLARDAARDGRLAGRLDRRLQPGAARRGARGAHRLLPLARAAAAPLVDRPGRARRRRRGRRAARGRRRRRRPVVRLPRLGRGVRARDAGGLRLGALLRAARLAARGLRGAARRRPAAVLLEGREPRRVRRRRLADLGALVAGRAGGGRPRRRLPAAPAVDGAAARLRAPAGGQPGRDRGHRAARGGVQPGDPPERARRAPSSPPTSFTQRRLLHGHRPHPATVARPARGGDDGPRGPARRGGPADHPAAAARRAPSSS